MMKTSPLSLLSERYLSALQSYLQQASPEGLQLAHDLGDEAVVLGLETFALASIHQQTIDTLKLPDHSSPEHDEMVARAAIFFTEAITPIEGTHRFALESVEDLQQLNATLDQRTQTLSDTRRKVKEEAMEREIIETEFRISEQYAAQLLRESKLMEEHLQAMVYKILSATELERKVMSHQLQDEIAQTLLGIHVRLLKLKKEADVSKVALSEELSTLQRLVDSSVETINQLAHEFSTPHETEAQ